MSWNDHPHSRYQTIGEHIKQRRVQMLVHSCIYYVLADSVVSDHQWQQWANELRDTQQRFGGEIGFFDDAFRDWDGSTGFHLPLRNPVTLAKAQWLLGYVKGAGQP